MKLSFSTRGWSYNDFDTAVEDAKSSHFDAIEIYNLLKNPNFTDRDGAFHPYHTAQTLRTLRENKLSISCLDSSFDLSSEEDTTEQIIELIEKSHDVCCKYVAVRVNFDNEKTVVKRLNKLIAKLDRTDVVLLIKTCGVYANTQKLRELLDFFASDNLAALWSVHHPYRENAESADTTIKNLGAYIKHVHLRDSDSQGNFSLVGEGTLPVDDMMRALRSIDYNEFISLEWKPEWIDDLQHKDIIFPHFVNYMSRFEKLKGKKKALYPNHDGTGHYVWEKDSLLDLTFAGVLDTMAEEFPDQYAFKYTTLDYTRTYEEFRQDVNTFARALIAMGVKQGSKVAVWATNVPAWFIAFWATVKIGAVLVSVNTAYKIHELEYLLRQSDTHTLITVEGNQSTSYASILKELCPEIDTAKKGDFLHCKRLPFLRNIITVDFNMNGCYNFEEAMKLSENVDIMEVERIARSVMADDVCNMQYTSGTTGFPKGVMLTQYNVVNDGKSIGDRMDLSTADRLMIQVPMFHCFGMVLAMTAAMTHGATLCPLPYFSAKASLACIDKEKITCFHGVPTMFIAMFNHEDYRKTDFSYMRTGIMAGAGCPAELMRRAADPNEMNMTGIVSVYGQTESAPGSTMSAWDDPIDVRCETVGYAFPHIECKIIDPETGEELPDGVNGEFCSRGYNTMKGYYKMPEATRETIDEEGWLHSGDLACRDSRGCYRITGRLKDMIIRGGENLYPKEIEEFFYTHPAVRDVQVIGVPDERYGEEAMAQIILKEGYDVTLEELKSYAIERLARHKVPRYIELTSSFPMNAAGKVLKYKMREDAIERLGLKK